MPQAPVADSGFFVVYPERGETALVTGGANHGAVGLVIPGTRGGWRFVVTRPGSGGEHPITRYPERPAAELAQVIAVEFPHDLAGLEWFAIEGGETTLRRIERPAGLIPEPLAPAWLGGAEHG